ncbi:hypothetical protein E4U54_003396 [Claviceps lovelessii]|nr:hypothetical protein E4U54_003396 [Claviceps lovelessii]
MISNTKYVDEEERVGPVYDEASAPPSAMASREFAYRLRGRGLAQIHATPSWRKSTRSMLDLAFKSSSGETESM